jgi:hypothetical protein
VYEVEVWVPTKGWKSVYRGPSIERAAALFDALQPLEVRMSYPAKQDRQSRTAGVPHVAAEPQARPVTTTGTAERLCRGRSPAKQGGGGVR